MPLSFCKDLQYQCNVMVYNVAVTVHGVARSFVEMSRVVMVLTTTR